MCRFIIKKFMRVEARRTVLSPWRTSALQALLLLTLLVGLSYSSHGGVKAQESADLQFNNLFGVVRAQGASLLDDASGEAKGGLSAGALVVALARSGQDGLLFVQSEGDGSGWVAAASLMIVNPASLPLKIPQFRQHSEAAPSRDAGGGEVAATDKAELVNDGTNQSPAGPSTAKDSPLDEQPTAAGRLTVADLLTNHHENEPVMNGDDIVGEVNLRLNNLNLRTGPGADYPLIGSAKPGSRWQIRGQSADGSWVQIALGTEETKAGDSLPWAATRFFTITGSLDAVAVISEIVPPPSAPPSSGAVTTLNQSSVQSTGVFGLSGSLVFQDRIGGTIYIYRFATGTLTPITSGVDPSISPDGQQVAFTRDGGGSGLYLIGVDGSNERLIFNERSTLRSPKWSPDGSKIVFSQGSGVDQCRILSGSACFPDEKILGSLPPELQGVADVEKLVKDLPYNQEYFFSLARIGVDGTDYRDVPGLDKSTAPDWANGGIVYQSDVGIQITADSGDARSQQIAHDPNQGYFHDPDWQPDGGRIVFHRKMGQHWQIFGVNSDGSGLVALTRPITALVDELPSNVSPAWSPDGQHIVYLSNRSSIESAGTWHFWVMDADGGNQRLLPVDVPLGYTFSSEQMVSWGP